MAVQEILQSDLFEGLPRIIGLPSCHPARPDYRKTPLAEVCVPEELPPYLLLGSLDRASFQSAEAGWSARWVGAATDTFVEAKYERATRQLQLRQVWRGVDGGRSFVPTDDFGRGVQMLYMPFPEVWDHAIAPRLEGAYRLKYVLQQQDQASFTGIPDGGFKTICVPVPIARLTTLHQCFSNLGSDPEFAVPAGGRLELRFSAVNHVTGRGPRWTEDPDRLFAASFDANGLLPLGPPQLEQAQDGSSAWTVRRLVYLAFIQVPFAGAEFLVERLAEHGLIRRRTEDEEREPGVEFDALVAPSAIDLQGSIAAWMDAQGARRVFYEINSKEELAAGGVERMMEASAQTDEDARELIRQAVLVSVRQRNWVANLVEGSLQKYAFPSNHVTNRAAEDAVAGASSGGLARRDL